MNSRHSDNGFTIVEVIVTMVVLSIFLAGIVQIFLLLESQRINVARQSKANDIAYSYLRKYTVRPEDPVVSGASLRCRVSSGSSRQSIETASLTNEKLGTGAKVDVYASSKDDRTCSGVEFPDDVVKIEVVVTYSTDEEVRHATFVRS
jgi:prepilin-type N-terminal cleavage/methylation domain-containing protein